MSELGDPAASNYWRPSRALRAGAIALLVVFFIFGTLPFAWNIFLLGAALGYWLGRQVAYVRWRKTGALP